MRATKGMSIIIEDECIRIEGVNDDLGVVDMRIEGCGSLTAWQ